MLSIGQFAQIGQVTIKLLRYYDRIGLLKPVSINDETGYRYYVIEQLADLNRIIALKNLGLSLKEIRAMLHDNVSLPEMRGMLKLKQAEIRQQLEQSQRQLSEVETRLSLLEGGSTQIDVAFKSIAPQKVISVRRPIQHGDEIDPTFEHLRVVLKNHNLQFGNAIGIYHPYTNDTCTSRLALVRSDGTKLYFHELPGSGFADLEAAFTVQNNASSELQLTSELWTGRVIQSRTLPAIDHAATVVFHGSFHDRGTVYHAFAQQAQEGGYRLSGAIREVYLRVADGDPYHPENIVEIQFPIERA
ncbi:MAG: MerR family transcriptional regulator [Aggregatilineales bacterium]